MRQQQVSNRFKTHLPDTRAHQRYGRIPDGRLYGKGKLLLLLWWLLLLLWEASNC